LGVPPDSLIEAIKSLWPLHRLTALLAWGGPSSLAYPLAPLYLLLAVCGSCVLFRRNWQVGLVIFAPFFAAVAAAVVHLYPFSDRLILFLLPAIFLGIAAGIDLVRIYVSRRSLYAGVAAAILLTIPAVFPVIREPPPYRIDDVKAALSYLRDHREAGDGVYVFYNAMPPMSFYGPEFGFGRKDYTAGECHRGETHTYLSELDGLRGQRRIWVLTMVSHTGARLHHNILLYLDAIGQKLDYFVAPTRTINGLGSPVELYLYDFGNSQRLNAISATSFQVDGAEDVFSCDIGPIAMSRLHNFGDHE
jgi:hypothetical protein